jgi:hypothetical protein
MNYLCDLEYEEVVYLDADVRVLTPLTAVYSELAKSSILLTPHLIEPYPEDGGRPGEDTFLVAGAFNAGFLAIQRDDVSRKFLSWWMRRLQSDCYTDYANGMYVDQKWLSLVPGLFDQVRVLRDPTINAGHWSLPQYPLSFDAENRACIDQRPIAMFHFSGFSPSSPSQFDRDQTRTTLKKEPVLSALVKEYHTAVGRYNHGDFQELGCEYDRLSDGTVIRPEWREAIRRRHPLFATVDDPFNVDSVKGLVRKYQSIEPEARKWRKDWRLKGVSNSRQVKKLKQFERKIKSFLHAVGLRKKAA